MDNKYNVTDLVVSAIEQRPLDFETAFNDLVVDKLRDAVETKKVEIAQQMYGYEPDVEPEEYDDAETEENEEEIPEEEINGEESE
jgi:hypothetical protein